MKIVTFNLRCVWIGDGINGFIHRAGMITEKIREEKPDIVCFQEGIEKTIAHLRRALPEYDIVFNQRDADYGGEGLATAIRRDTMTLRALDFFWMSPTPNVPGSRFEGQGCPRVCQVVLVSDKDRKFMRVYNTHLDFASEDARVPEIRCLLDRVKRDREIADFPLFILGDFNALPDSETIRFCNGYEPVPIADMTADVGGTFHDFGKAELSKIDYIYADRQTAGKKYTASVWDDERDGIYLSDHYPVALDVEL